jgi:hypothetical protein
LPVDASDVPYINVSFFLSFFFFSFKVEDIYKIFKQLRRRKKRKKKKKKKKKKRGPTLRLKYFRIVF